MLEKHKIVSYSCVQCMKEVPFESFEQHIREKHNGKFKKIAFQGVETCLITNAAKKGYSISVNKLQDNIIISMVLVTNPTFLCQLCDENKGSETEIYDHMETHHFLKDKINCKICNEEVSIHYLTEHISNDHASDKLVQFYGKLLHYNYIISTIEETKNCLTIYEPKRNDRNFMSCTLCTQELNDLKSVNKHLALAHNVIALSCLTCSTVLKFHELNQHLDVCLKKPNKFLFQEDFVVLITGLKWMVIFANSPENQFVIKIMKTWSEKDTFECEMCNLSFDASTGLGTHINDNHFTFKLFICPSCPRNCTFGDLQSHYNYHHRVAKKQKAISFKTGYFMHFAVVSMNHQILVKVTVKGGNQKSSICEMCAESFWYAHTLQKHMNSKHLIRCYVCTRCQKEVLFKNFSDHIINHCIPQDYSIETYFRCTLSKVSPMEYSYNLVDGSEYENLQLNLVTKGNLKTFNCEMCPCSFKTKQCLNSHLTNTHLISGFSCLECKKSATFESLESHPIRHNKSSISFTFTYSLTGSSQFFYVMELDWPFRNNCSQLSITFIKASSINLFRCLACDDSYNCFKSYQTHIASKHFIKRFLCSQCNTNLLFQDTLSHLRNSHSVELKRPYIFVPIAELIDKNEPLKVKVALTEPKDGNKQVVAEEKLKNPNKNIGNVRTRSMKNVETIEDNISVIPAGLEPNVIIKTEPKEQSSVLKKEFSMSFGFSTAHTPFGKQTNYWLSFSKFSLGRPTYICNICTESLLSGHAFKMHIFKHHTKQEKLFCTVCSFNFKLLDVITGKHSHENPFILNFNEDFKITVPPIWNMKKCTWIFNVDTARKLIPNCEDFLKVRLCIFIKLETSNVFGNQCSICELRQISDIKEHVESHHLSVDSYFCKLCKCKVAFKNFISHTVKHAQVSGKFISLTGFKTKTFEKSVERVASTSKGPIKLMKGESVFFYVYLELQTIDFKPNFIYFN